MERGFFFPYEARIPPRFWHGTSSKLKIGEYLLPPAMTGVQREKRIKNTDVVFCTISKRSAVKYAKKAAKKYGGNPMVFEVEPVGCCMETVPGEYISKKARVLA